MPNQVDETTGDQSNTEHGPRTSKIGILISVLIIILVGAFCVGYFQLAKVNMALAEQVTRLQEQGSADGRQIESLAKSIMQLQQNSAKDTQADVLKKWYVLQAQYLVQLANDYIQFSQNNAAAAELLQRADQALQNVHDGSVDSIRQHLAQYIANMRLLPQVDVTALYTQLNELNSQIDQLPLPLSPLQKEAASAPTVDEEGLAWWQKGVNRTMNALRDIVIVRYNASKTMPLVMPEERGFLYQNLHAEIQNAMWAVLHRNATVYQASITHLISWIRQYFVQDAPATNNMLQSLAALQAIDIQSQVMNTAELLQQFNGYFDQNAKA